VFKFLPSVAGEVTAAAIPIFRALTPVVVDRNSPEGRGAAARMIKQRALSAMPWSEAEEQALQAAEAAADDEISRYKVKVQRSAAQVRGTKGMDPSYPPLLVFPEGVTTADSFLLQFKPGSFLAGTPVQPVVVKYPYCHYEVVWSCDMNILWSVYRMLCQVYNCMVVTYLPVYYPNEAEKADPQLFADNVRQKMWEAMQPGTEMTMYSYEDARLLAAAQEAYKTINPEITKDITYSEVHKWLNLSVEDTKKLISVFREADLDGDGFVSKDEFTKWLDLDPDSPTTESYFNLMDTEETGLICFRSFVQSLVLNSTSVGMEEKVQVLFWMYDTNQSGDISRQEIVNIMDASRLRRAPGGPEHKIDSGTVADAVMAGRDSLTFDEFDKAVEEHPELLECMTPVHSDKFVRAI